MDTIKEYIEQIVENVWVVRTFFTLITLILSVVLYKIINHLFFKRFEGEKINNLSKNKSKTYIKLLKNVVRYIFIIGTIIIILHICGVNVTSLVAGIGIAGVIIGLAIQDWLKDIIRGSSILSDNYFSVGDVVKYNDIEGRVISLGLKTTKLVDIKTGNKVSVANRNIDQIEVVSENLFVTVPMPYELPLDKAEEVVADIIRGIKRIGGVDDCIYKGVAELADSSIKYLINVKCDPSEKRQINRDANRVLLLTLAEYGISVPYNQIDVHQK